MPQIAQVGATYASQIFWLLLTFGLTFFVVGMVIFPKAQGTVRLRDDKIKGDLAAARAANAAADTLEEEHRQRANAVRADAQARLAEAKAAATRDREGKLAAADAELKAQAEAAEAAIAVRQGEAEAELETVAAEAARDIAARLAGAEVSEAAAREQVKAVMHG